jgi:hypothetical protein
MSKTRPVIHGSGTRLGAATIPDARLVTVCKQAPQGLYSGPAMFFQPPRSSPVHGFLPKTGEVGYSSHDV